jgi:hypothetical protein
VAPRLLRLAAAAVLCGVALPAIAQEAAQDTAQDAVREGVARNVYFTATGRDGAPARDLAPAEIAVRVDGKTGDVLAVHPATDPMQLVLLVDDSGPGIQYVRSAAGEIVRIVEGVAEIAIVSTAAQNATIVDFTSDISQLASAVRQLTTRSTSGGYLLDAIERAAATLGERKAPRPVIVVIALEGTEYSNISPARVFEAVRQSAAVVHVLSVGKPSLKTMTPWNQRPTQSIHDSLDETISRGTVSVEAPRRSGGRFEQVLEFTGLPTRAAEVARELRDQLVVTYAQAGAAGGAGKFDLSVKRRGIKVRAPKFVPSGQ